MEKRERNSLIFIALALAFVLLFNNNFNLSGNASKIDSYQTELNQDTYRVLVGNSVTVGSKVITLISIADSDEAIVDVSGIQKSVNLYGIRVLNDVQVQNVGVGNGFAILKLMDLGSAKAATCSDTDDGDIYLKGDCTDRFYQSKPITDFCDFDTLKEYACGYDEIIDEIYCLKHNIKCVDGCSNGACVSG